MAPDQTESPQSAPQRDTLAWKLHALQLRGLGWAAQHGITLLRLALGVVFVWFGAQKFFPGLSVAQDLATKTISALTFGTVGAQVSLPVLATWECLIGLGLLSGRFLPATLLLLLAQMAGTFMPLILFPGETFKIMPWVPNLEGQYIIKNLVLVAAALVVGATARGGRLIYDAQAAETAEHTQRVHERFRRRFHQDPEE